MAARAGAYPDAVTEIRADGVTVERSEADDGEILRSVAALAAAGADDEARRQLADLDPARVVPPKQGTTQRGSGGGQRPTGFEWKRIAAQTLTDDKWQCTYCNRRLIGSFVLAIVGALFPAEFRFNHQLAWKDETKRVHAAAERVYPNVDHTDAGSISGNWTDPANLSAICTPCNQGKWAKGGWTPTTLPRDPDWDGAVGVYLALLERPDVRDSRFHKEWKRALQLAGALTDPRM